MIVKEFEYALDVAKYAYKNKEDSLGDIIDRQLYVASQLPFKRDKAIALMYKAVHDINIDIIAEYFDYKVVSICEDIYDYLHVDNYTKDVLSKGFKIDRNVPKLSNEILHAELQYLYIHADSILKKIKYKILMFKVERILKNAYNDND